MAFRIEPTRLTLGRRLAGKTKARLAKDLDVSTSTVNLWESGQRGANPDVHLLVDSLRQPIEFFIGDEVPATSFESLTFRKRYDATRGTKDKAAAAIDLASGILQPAIKSFFTIFPGVDVPDLSGMSPEAAAITLRRHWQLTDGPIRDVVELLESKGIRVFWISDGSPSLSAFCKWVDAEPYLILNMARLDGCRSRFDACHELAHLTLHRDVDFETADPKQIEREADRFASAFLLPRETFVLKAPTYFEPQLFLDMKRFWKVSAQAMVRRLRDCGMLTEWQYESAFKWMSIEGWRSRPEPYAGPMETSKIHWKLCDRLEDRGITPKDFAANLNLQWESVARMMPLLQVRFMSLNIESLVNDDGPISVSAILGSSELPYSD